MPGQHEPGARLEAETQLVSLADATRGNREDEAGPPPKCIYCGHCDQMHFKECRNVPADPDPHATHAFDGPVRHYNVWQCIRCQGETRVEVLKLLP